MRKTAYKRKALFVVVLVVMFVAVFVVVRVVVCVIVAFDVVTHLQIKRSWITLNALFHSTNGSTNSFPTSFPRPFHPPFLRPLYPSFLGVRYIGIEKKNTKRYLTYLL